MSAELVAGASARDLVPGDPDSVDRLAARLSVFAEGMSDAASTLNDVQTAGWSGPAAEAFSTLVGEQPKKYRTAGSSFGEAVGALHAYTAVLRSAQADAGRAVSLIEQADQQSEQWRGQREAYDADVRTANASGEPPPDGPKPPASDPGGADRDAAQRLLADARERVRAQGRATASTLSAAADEAPDEPGLLDKMIGGAGEFFGGVWEGVKGIGDTVVMIAKLSTIRAIIDPEGWKRDATELGKGLVWGVTHPVEFAKAIVDWETWKSNPLRALGRLVPDAALALATGGTSAGPTGASRGARALERLRRLVPRRRRLPDDWPRDIPLGGPGGRRYGPATGSGPLGREPKWEAFKNSFRSGSYTANTYDQPRRLYRVYGGTSANPLSPYWTPVRPTGRLQAHSDSALPDGNTAERIVTIEVPPGVEMYDGIVAENFGKIGGGDQTVIPKVDPKWVVEDQAFP
jgi:hypothetical protein